MRQTAIKFQFLPYLIGVGLLTAVYFGGGKLGLRLSSVEGIVTLVWPPTGLALAALLLFGSRLWPGIALGAFLVNISAGAPPVVALGIAAGNTLEAVVGVYLLRRVVGFDNSLERLRDVLALVGLAVVVSPMMSATIGAASLGLGGIIPWTAYGLTWGVWWLGDALGALVVAPVLLTWGTDWRVDRRSWRLIEAAALLVSLVIVSQIAFGGWLAPYLVDGRLSFILLPFLVWAALRFSQRGAVTAILIGTGMAVWGTTHGFGPFVLETVHLSLVFLGGFVGTAAVMAMLLAAAMAERRRTEAALRAREKQAEANQQRLALLAEMRERHRLAQELHDTVVQTLGYLNLKITMANTLLANNRVDEARASLHEVKNVVGEVYTDVREEIFNLRAKVLSGLSYMELLERYVDKYRRFYHLNIHLVQEADPALFEFPTDVSPQIIRTIQEALINIRKHAQVDTAIIRLNQENGQIRISIEDQGQGFDLAKLKKKTSSFGLQIMRERVESVGGSLEIDTFPGQGTRIILRYQR